MTSRMDVCGVALLAHDLHDAAVAEADNRPDLAVAEAAIVGVADGLVPGGTGCCISLDGAGEVLRWVGHAPSVENLTARRKACRKVHMNSYWITSPFTPGAMQHYVDRHDAHEAAQAHADRFECPVHIYATPTTDGERVATVRPTP